MFLKLRNFHLMLLIVTLGLGLSLSGCGLVSHGFDREEMRTQLALQFPSITDEDIKKASLTKSDLISPFSVAIFFRETVDRDLTNTRSSQWTDFDRKKIFESFQKLKSDSVISDFTTLNPLTVPGRDLKSLLLAGAHAHTDTILQISGIGSVDIYDNIWALSYLPLFPLLFVRGTNVDVLYKVKAELWDIKNQYLFFSIDTESILKETRPGWLIYQDLILERTKILAIEKMRPILLKKMVELKFKSSGR